MTYQISVCYGHPDDPATFDEYYRSTHLPLFGKVPAVAGFTYGTCRSLDGSQAQFYSVAQITFDTEEDLQRALSSPEMKVAGKDVRNFATGGVTMFVSQLETAW